MNFTEKLSSQIKNSPFYCRPLAFMSAAFLISLFLFKLGIFYFCVFLTFIFIYSLYLIITGIKKFNLKNPLPFLLIMSTLITPFISCLYLFLIVYSHLSLYTLITNLQPDN